MTNGVFAVIASISTPETEGNLSTRNLSSEWVGDMLSGGSFLGGAERRGNLMDGDFCKSLIC